MHQSPMTPQQEANLLLIADQERRRKEREAQAAQPFRRVRS